MQVMQIMSYLVNGIHNAVQNCNHDEHENTLFYNAWLEVFLKFQCTAPTYLGDQIL